MQAIFTRKTILILMLAVFVITTVALALIVTFADENAAEAASLRQGSSGAQVREIQQRLKNWGYYSGSVDGIFGSGTRSAVIKFQRNNGLTADGIVGNATAAAIGITLSSSGTTTTSSSASVLKRGSSGSKVSEMQQKLKNWGYYSGSVDGIFSANTIYSEFHIAILKRSEFIIHLQVAVDEFDSLIEKMNALPMMEMHQEVIQELHDSFLDSLKEIEASEDFQLNQELMKKTNLVLGQLRWMWELLQQYQVESCKLKVAPIDYMCVLSRSVIVGTVLAVTYAIVTQKSRKKLKEL